MKSSLLKAALILLIPGFAMAQTNSFTVTGTSLKSVNPTELIITAGVTSEGANAEKQFQMVSEVMSKGIGLVKGKKGIKSFETDIVRINKSYASTTVNMFRAMQSITIVITDFALYDELMLELFALGFNDIQNVEFSIGNMAEVKRQAQIEAIQAAKEKAVVFAKELNVELGPVISFSEQNFYSPYANTANYKTMDAGAVSGPSIAPNQVEVMMSVIVSFALKTDK